MKRVGSDNDSQVVFVPRVIPVVLPVIIIDVHNIAVLAHIQSLDLLGLQDAQGNGHKSAHEPQCERVVLILRGVDLINAEVKHIQ